FANFVRAFVGHYSVAPYNVTNWEFFNEGDNTDMGQIGSFLGGCFGNDPAAYVDMLHIAYDTVKQINPEAKVLPGGFAHESDPSFFNFKFIDQILALGAARYFDVMNIHYYSCYAPVWAAYGPDVIGKVTAVRQLMARYGVDKPVAVTEIGYVNSHREADDFQEKQAQYATKVLARAKAADLYTIIWFSLFDWNEREYPYGLINLQVQPRQAYLAFQVAAAQFGSAKFERQISSAEIGATGPVEGYIFEAGGKERWVLWSEMGNVQVTLPPGVSSAQNNAGQPSTHINSASPGGTVTLGESPLYMSLR
ncbi:MAG: hypothetical protein Q7O66_01645, partial [Dehalococcoidia bacterium]|nr:hypothetical protein [Dehalococcoidia bacterium]